MHNKPNGICKSFCWQFKRCQNIPGSSHALAHGFGEPTNDWESMSGYIHWKPEIYGFGNVHLSGIGCTDLGNVVLMPTKGAAIPGKYIISSKCFEK